MWSIDTEIRFDDAAAANAVRVVRSAAAALQTSLVHRTNDVARLDEAWEGYAQRWFSERNESLVLVGAVTVDHLRSVADRIEAARLAAHHDRQAQAAARAARDEALRVEAARVEAARVEAARVEAARIEAAREDSRAREMPDHEARA